MRRIGLWLTVGLLMGVLAACGGRGGGATGALQVGVAGLPVGIDAQIEVTGPGGFVQQVSQSQTLTGLVPGSYTVSAGAISGYTAQVSGSPATVQAGTTAQVFVTYQAGSSAGDSISGTVSIVGAAGTAQSARSSAAFVPGEVIVKFKPGVRAQSVDELARLESVRELPLDGVGLYRMSGELGAQSADVATDTLRLVAELAARDDVLYAHPNYLLEPFAEPNDPLYGAQWHLRAINLPSAWDQTTGSASVTVAVLDSGILPTHPDLAGKLAPGYDFVSSTQVSGDGDGRDGDPTDPEGDFHGSHVAGTVAAATNNGVGVAGVSWGSRILPVRVLGAQSGTLADAIDGILWSVGESVPGVPNNPNPADVLNLSLGGEGLCGSVGALQDAFDEANAVGAAVVVAAGNFDEDASNFIPASCGGVITVGATTLTGGRASYSNYGARIDVMAPGGDVTQDADGDGEPDGVLSTVFDTATGDNGYAYYEGTSMASPHVAGVIALMKSVRPSLSGAEARDILQSTAQPISGGSCSVGCGAGLIDAAAALAALQAPAEPDFALSLSPATVSLSAGESASAEVRVSRSGGFSSEVAFSISGLPGGLSASFTPSATTEDSARLTLSATAGLEGDYTLEIQGVGDGISKTVPLSVVVTGDDPVPVADIAGAVVGACYYVNNTCDENLSRVVRITQSGNSAPYTIPGLSAINYIVAAFKDGNDDGDLNDADDYVGTYLRNGQPADVVPPASGIDVLLTPALVTQAQQRALLEFWERHR